MFLVYVLFSVVIIPFRISDLMRWTKLIPAMRGFCVVIWAHSGEVKNNWVYRRLEAFVFLGFMYDPIRQT